MLLLISNLKIRWIFFKRRGLILTTNLPVWYLYFFLEISLHLELTVLAVGTRMSQFVSTVTFVGRPQLLTGSTKLTRVAVTMTVAPSQHVRTATKNRKNINLRIFKKQLFMYFSTYEMDWWCLWECVCVGDPMAPYYAATVSIISWKC